MNKLIKSLTIHFICAFLLSLSTSSTSAVVLESTQYSFILMQHGEKVTENKFYLAEEGRELIDYCTTYRCHKFINKDKSPYYLYKKPYGFPYETQSDGARVRVNKREATDELVAILDLPYVGEAVYKYGIVDLDKVGPDKVGTFQEIPYSEYYRETTGQEYVEDNGINVAEYTGEMFKIAVVIVAFVVFWRVHHWMNKKRKKGKNA